MEWKRSIKRWLPAWKRSRHCSPAHRYLRACVFYDDDDDVEQDNDDDTLCTCSLNFKLCINRCSSFEPFAFDINVLSSSHQDIWPPLKHGVPQGLDGGEVGQVAEVKLGCQSLRFEAGYCSLSWINVVAKPCEWFQQHIQQVHPNRRTGLSSEFQPKQTVSLWIARMMPLFPATNVQMSNTIRQEYNLCSSNSDKRYFTFPRASSLAVR